MNKAIIYILLISAVVILAGFFASSFPDGLEWVAEKTGFLEKGKGFTSLMTDYVFPGIANDTGATIIAGIVGCALVFTIFAGANIMLKPKRRKANAA